jgi:DNA-binding MarR family transcriptional regulator
MTEPDAHDRADPDLEGALVQAAFTVTAVLSRVAAAHDLSLTQLRVLGILRDRRLRMTVLAEFLGLERSTLSGLVDRAVARGLVRRERSLTDGRAVEVMITAEGAALAHAGAAEVRVALAPLAARLSADERDRLWVLLQRMLPRLATESDSRSERPRTPPGHR